MPEPDRTLALALAAAREHGVEHLIGVLEKMSSSELTSILLHLFRARRRDFSEIRAQFDRSAMVQPSTADARALLRFDNAAFDAAAAFEAIELSPAAPLGLSASTGIDQNNVLSAARNLELLADPTNAQSLECARRRKLDRTKVVKLCSSHRVLRLQPFDLPGFTPHFRLFSLVTAGRDTGDERFERAALMEQLAAWLEMLTKLGVGPLSVEVSHPVFVRALLIEAGVDLDALRAVVRGHVKGAGDAIAAKASLPRDVRDPSTLCGEFVGRLVRVRDEVFGPLAEKYPGVEMTFDLSRLEGLQYYSAYSYRVCVDKMAVIDGGFTTWTQELLADKKERLLIGAVGSEFVTKKYRSADATPVL